MTTTSVTLVDQTTGETVKSFDVTGQSTGYVDRLVMGLYSQVDLDRFFVREVGPDDVSA